MRVQNWIAFGVLLAGTMAWAQGESEGDRWANTPLAEGGLKLKDGKLPDRASSVPRGNPAKLDAFRNAYYFYYARQGGGGLDFSIADSLELAADHVDGSNPVRAFQEYQTVFFDRFPEKYGELIKKGKKPADAYEDAMEYATQQASNVVGNSTWEVRWRSEPATDVEKEVHDWAARDKGIFGGGLDESRAMSLAKSASLWASRGGEGLDRMTTHKAVAVRSLFLMASATVQAGGLGYGDTPDRSIALINEFLPLDNSVVRVEIFRNSFHRHMADARSPGKTFDNALKLAKAEAFGAKIERDVNGNVKVTPVAPAG